MPLDLTQANLSANQYRAACSDFVSDIGHGRGVGCEVYARYGRIVSAFRTNVSPSYMSMEDFIQVLQTIDRHMLQCVDTFADIEWEEE